MSATDLPIIVFIITANAVTPTSVIIPSGAHGHRVLEIVPPANHAWTLYDPDAANGVPRSTDYVHYVNRNDGGLTAFIQGTTICKVKLDTGSADFLCILS